MLAPLTSRIATVGWRGASVWTVTRLAAGWAFPPLGALALALPVAVAGQQAADPTARAGRVELVRELAIGANPSRPQYEFAGIGFAAMTGSGGVFVSDGPAALIRRYDGLGRFRGDVGRIGSGPGEYRGIAGMAVVGDSLLVVYDRGNGRVVLFDTAGTYCGSFRVSGGGFLPSRAFAVFSDGILAVRARVVQISPRGPGGVESVFVRYRLNGEILDSIRVPPEEMAGMVLVDRTLGPRWAFPAATVFTLLPRAGIATAHTTTYRVEVAPARGPAFVIERDAQRIPLDGREREEWEALMRFVAQQSPVAEIPAIPRDKPIIRDLFADVDGRIWVSLYTQASRRNLPARAAADPRPTLTIWEHNAYDVFDERGRYLGRVDLPPASRLLAVRGNRAWVSEETEQGEVVLVRYGLRMPPVP